MKILTFQEETQTIRQMPENYCIAVKKNGKWELDFDMAANKELVHRTCEALFEHKLKYGTGLELLAAITPNQDFIFKVGEYYRYSKIPNDDTEELTVNDYGLELLGQNAIHIRYHKNEKDIWFVWEKMANEAIYKCVYNN